MSITDWNTGPSLADQATLIELGLNPVRRAEALYEWLDFGTVEVDDGEAGTVKVEATYAPATFWRFTIHSLGRTTVLETGSGTLADFWPIAEKFASGMLYASAKGGRR